MKMRRSVSRNWDQTRMVSITRENKDLSEIVLYIGFDLSIDVRIGDMA